MLLSLVCAGLACGDPLFDGATSGGSDAGDAGATDASGDDGGDAVAIDAGPDASAPPCDRSKPFGEPEPVLGINSAVDETSATFSADERTVFLARSPIGDAAKREIYVARRPTREDPFDTPTSMAEVNSNAEDDNASVTADGLLLVMHSARGGVGNELYSSKRADAGEPFPNPSLLPNVDGVGSNIDPFVMPDAKKLYFARDTVSLAKYDLFVALGDGNGLFVGPMQLEGLDDDSNEMQPVVRADDLELFYASDRGSSSFDVRHATRSATSTAFGPSSPVAELNTAGYDAPTWISPDGCRLYLSSDRTNTVGGRDIWVATRPK